MFLLSACGQNGALETELERGEPNCNYPLPQSSAETSEQILHWLNWKEIACKNQVDEKPKSSSAPVTEGLLSENAWNIWRKKSIRWGITCARMMKSELKGFLVRIIRTLLLREGRWLWLLENSRPPDLYGIVQRHLLSGQSDVSSVLPATTKTGGWGKSVRNALSKQQQSLVKRRRGGLIETGKKVDQQMRKSGRGWLPPGR